MNKLKEHIPDFPIEKVKKRQAKTRNHSLATETAMIKSIQAFGVVEPILLDEDFEIIHGEYRYEIAKKRLGMKTIPAIVVEGLDKDVARAYHLMANHSTEWHYWVFPETDKILAGLDGGLATETILGYEAPSEAGEWRDLLREIGWFIEIMPENLSASTVNLDKLALLLQNQLSAEKGKYQFDDNQLLYMEGMRRQLKELQQKMIEEGELTEEEIAEVKDIFDAKRELRYSVKKQIEWEEANRIDAKRPSEMRIKGTADGKIMGLAQFIEFGTKFCSMGEEEAKSFFNAHTAKEFNDYCRKIIEEDQPLKKAKKKEIQSNKIL